MDAVTFDDEKSTITMKFLINAHGLITTVNKGLQSKHLTFKGCYFKYVFDFYNNTDGFHEIKDRKAIDIEDNLYLGAKIVMSSKDYPNLNGIMRDSLGNEYKAKCIDDCLYYKLSYHILGTEYLLFEFQHEYEYLPSFLKMYKDISIGKYCDTKIMVDEVEFNCHKIILAGESDYFEKAFAFPSDEKILIIKSCSSKIFSIILKTIYIGDINIGNGYVNDLEDIIFDVLLAARYFCIDSIIEECIKILKTTITNDNIFRRYSMIKKIDVPELTKIYTDYIENMDVEHKSDELISLIEDIPIEYVKKMRTILSKDK